MQYSELPLPVLHIFSASSSALPHSPGPANGSLYARVRKRSRTKGDMFPQATSGPIPSDLALSASSDSGFSIASQWTGVITAVSPGRGPSEDERTQQRRLLSGVGLEKPQPPLEDMTKLPASSNGEGKMDGDKEGSGQPVNEEALPSERETDILDDDEFIPEASPALDRHSLASIGSLSSESLPEAQQLVQSGSGYSTPSTYTTQSWVQQQQAVDAPEGEEQTDQGWDSPVDTPPLIGPDTLSVPDMPNTGTSRREAVQRRVEGGVGVERSPVQMDSDKHSTHTTYVQHSPHATHTPLPSGEPCGQEELASLVTDMDESIEQLNRLILDLDPTFIPVPTRHPALPLSRSASLHTNGIRQTTTDANTSQSGWKHRQASDVTDYPGFHSPGWSGAQTFQNSLIFRPNLLPSQHGRLYRMEDYEGQTPVTESCDIVPPTPAFPVSPPTPYVKSCPVVSYLRHSKGQWEMSRTSQDSRSFLDGSMNQTPASSNGELFCSEVSFTPATCQRMFGSMHSVPSRSTLPHTNSQTPPPVWLDRTPMSLSSPFLPPSSSSLSPLSLLNAHRSPLGAQRDLEWSGGQSRCERNQDAQSQGDIVSLLLGNGHLGLEDSLLEAVEGLGGLDLGLGLGEDGLTGLPPVLPEKRVPGLAGSRSPSLSGLSSPHSGSSLSIPFPSAMTPAPFRGLSPGGGGAPLPVSDPFSSKQDNVKFVQDTSKFWYKPDISRDQAIGVLKDKEPGSFIVRDSHSFRGAYGLAIKVATPPPSVLTQSKKVGGDLSNELVRHFLIECTQKGVQLKGCPNEPYFGSLTALICQHSITPLALPCKLIIPERETSDPSTQSVTNSAAELLKQGAACSVWFLGSVELESLTGYQAVQKAASLTLAMDPPPTSTVVNFKVSTQGITLTDNQRKLFFRRHYTVNTVIFCALDPQDRKWTRDGCSSAKIFGFVARKSMSGTENVCHLFAEHDPEQPASAIVNFVSKVMIGSLKK
ncbi:LOW QUALITY PROTEIN: tensin-3-like [Oncorhynchus clarkii lewisi]|uniref:LOW QUALITY PROTEIN: tensin-3-like n=1 Tax=Oncorhynchus clarkii lewisi TaxID=490388 RepID=UPI0039B8991F